MSAGRPSTLTRGGPSPRALAPWPLLLALSAACPGRMPGADTSPSTDSIVDGWIGFPDSVADRGAGDGPPVDGSTPPPDAAAGKWIEAITAYGKIYNFDIGNGHAPLAGNGADLTTISRYASGPCAGKAAGACKLDTHTAVTLSGKLVESITAHGKYYNFDVTNNFAPWTDNGSDLTTVSRYASGPCAGKAAGNCVFDSRTFATVSGTLIESITAYGKTYDFDVNNGSAPLSSNGADLTTVSRYASGPCTGKSAGTCVFDSRTGATVSGSLVESITAHGKYYNFEVSSGFAPWTSNGSDLTTVSRYASGPCAGRSGSGCVFETREVVRLP